MFLHIFKRNSHRVPSKYKYQLYVMKKNNAERFFLINKKYTFNNDVILSAQTIGLSHTRCSRHHVQTKSKKGFAGAKGIFVTAKSFFLSDTHGISLTFQMTISSVPVERFESSLSTDKILQTAFWRSVCYRYFIITAQMDRIRGISQIGFFFRVLAHCESRERGELY